jgi:hypothetical protein
MPARQALVIFRKNVAKRFELSFEISCVVRGLYSMMKVDLDFAKAVRLQIRHEFQEGPVILLSWKKIRMEERFTI